MNGTILYVRDVAKEIKEFAIKIDQPVRFLSGQYVMISFEDRSLDRRAYSISEYDAFQKTIKILVKLAGEFTQKLFQLSIGDALFIYGPYGKFVLKDASKGVFIAGGIGIVPLYSMFRQLINTPGADAHMFYSCRKYEEMALKHELSNMRNVHTYFTREGSEKHFDVSELTKIDDYKSYAYYICGPEKMMAEIVSGLEGLGIEKIYTESFILRARH